MMTAHCPYCGTPCDLTNRLSGDRTWCPACGGWFLITFQPGGAQLTKTDPPTTWPKETKKARG